MRIAMSRGDIKWERFIINTPEGEPSEIDFSNIYFTVKRSTKDKDYLFQKSLRNGDIYKLGPGDYELKIAPEDTYDLAVGDYKFDIQISFKDLLKETYVGDFVVKEEVTYIQNEEGEDGTTSLVLPSSDKTPGVIIEIPEYHLITLETPLVVSRVDYDELSNLEIDIITGSATSELAFSTLMSMGGNVRIETDLNLTTPINITKDTVLDLSGKTITGAGTYSFIVNGCTVTLKNGTINTSKRVAHVINGGTVIVQSGTYEAGSAGFTANGPGSKIIFNGGTLTGQTGGIGLFSGAEAEINDGTIIGQDDCVIFTNELEGKGENKIVMNGGEIIAYIHTSGFASCGVYIANNDTFTMNGGSILSHSGCGLLMRAGTVVFNDGRIEAKGEGRGKVDEDNTKLTHSAVVYHEAANFPAKEGMSLTINGGTFIGTAYSVDIVSNEKNPNVFISGGKFTPGL